MSSSEEMSQPMEGLRARHGEGALELCGEEAAELGSRALVISSNHPEPHEKAALETMARVLRRAQVGNHPFPQVPRPGIAMGRCVELAAEAARESRCRLIMGLGEGDALNAAREAAGQTLLPCLLLPTSVGYGEPWGSPQRPLPDILIVDPRLAVGSAPGRTAVQGLELFAALLEPYAAVPPAEVQDLLASALRLLVDSLPGAVKRPEDPSHRRGLAEATATAARVLGQVGSRFPPMKELLRRLVPDGPVAEGVLAGVIPAVLAAGSDDKGPFPRSRVAQLGRQILAVREDDDGRAASWTAGGIRQWILNLGLQPTLTGAPAARAREDEQLRAVLSGALR